MQHMQPQNSDPVGFAVILVLQFVLSATLMFYKKAFLEFLPHPFFVSFSNGLLLVPVSLFIAWSSRGFPKSLAFLRPPREIVPWLAASAVLHAVSVILVNIGFFASDLDFVLLMRLGTLVWHGMFGYLFLGERLSSMGMFAVAIVVVGIILVVYDFEWSVAKMPSKMQIVVQLLSNMLMSVGGLLTKMIMNVISQTGTTFRILDYLVLTSVMSLPTTFLVSIWKEPVAWRNIGEIITWKFIQWSVFGTVVHELVHLALAELHKRASLISMGIIGQMRIVGTLAISYFVNRQTQWDMRKLIGVGFLVLGGIVYTVSPHKSAAKDRPAEPTSDDGLLAVDRETFPETKASL